MPNELHGRCRTGPLTVGIPVLSGGEGVNGLCFAECKYRHLHSESFFVPMESTCLDHINPSRAMTQHVFISSMKDGRKVEVMAGWDRPLQGFFLLTLKPLTHLKNFFLQKK